MLIVSRSGWDAAPPVHEPNRIPIPTPRLWVHHTAGSERGAAGMRAIQRYHQIDKGWNDIAYSFVVDPDGTVYEGRGVGIAGAHTEGDNSSSHAICLMGNFEVTIPTIEALNSLVELARIGRDRGWWTPTLGGHRDAPGAQTACPGRNLYATLPRVRQLVAQPQEEDMPLNDVDITRIKAAMRSVLNEGTGAGQTTWAGTSKADLAADQAAINKLNAIAGAVGRITAEGFADAVIAKLGTAGPGADQAVVEAAIRAVFADLAEADG